MLVPVVSQDFCPSNLCALICVYCMVMVIICPRQQRDEHKFTNGDTLLYQTWP